MSCMTPAGLWGLGCRVPTWGGGVAMEPLPSPPPPSLVEQYAATSPPRFGDPELALVSSPPWDPDMARLMSPHRLPPLGSAMR